MFRNNPAVSTLWNKFELKKRVTLGQSINTDLKQATKSTFAATFIPRWPLTSLGWQNCLNAELDLHVLLIANNACLFIIYTSVQDFLGTASPALLPYLWWSTKGCFVLGLWSIATFGSLLLWIPVTSTLYFLLPCLAHLYLLHIPSSLLFLSMPTSVELDPICILFILVVPNDIFWNIHSFFHNIF